MKKGAKYSGIGESLEAVVGEKDPRDVNLLLNNHPIRTSTVDKKETVVNDTEEAKRTYEEAQAQAKAEMQVEYVKALKDFYSDESYFDEFKDCEPLGKEVLVKIFFFQPPKELASKRALGETELIISSKFDKQLKTTTQALYERYYPVVKVIKKGSDKDLENIKIGELYTVPAVDIEGEQWNPDFLHYMNTFAKVDNGKHGIVHTPPDMPPKIQSIKLTWDRYKFQVPGSVKESDGSIYLIPSVKLKTPYRI
jgi:hypothetical protein